MNEKLNSNIDEKKEIEKVNNKLTPDAIFFELIDSESNTTIDKSSAPDICHMLYSSLITIFDKYSSHTEIMPSFDDFTIKNNRDANNNVIGFCIIFNEDKIRKFEIKITQNKDISQEILNSVYTIIDNEILCVFTRKGYITNAYMKVILTPYGFVEAAMMDDSDANSANILSIAIRQANKNSYKDLHDTILGYSLLMSYSQAYFKSRAVCHEKDIETDKNTNGQIGIDIAYKRCMLKKINCDIAIHSQYINNINATIDKQKKIVSNHSKTIKKCKKSALKIKNALEEYK